MVFRLCFYPPTIIIISITNKKIGISFENFVISRLLYFYLLYNNKNTKLNLLGKWEL